MSLSEIRVNTTKTRTGVGTITYTETGPVITGIATASNFKTGSTNVHSTGVELANINTGGSTATFGGAISGTSATLSGALSGTTASFTGNVSIGGTLTYEDVTNIDSVGILTARSGINISDTTQSTSTTTGALKVAGGAGIVKNLNVGGNLTATGEVTIPTWITHTGDPNTKFGFEGPDTITAETGGAERLRITSGGYLGIGAGANTNKPLHIYTGSSDSEIRLQTNSGTEQNSYISLRQSSGDLDFYTVQSGTNMKFHTVNTERLRITSTGLIYVNRDTVGGRIDATAGDGSMTFSDGNGRQTFKIATMASGQSAAHVFDANGRFGVGTASPTARLDVRRGDADGKIAEFHTSTGYGIDIGSSQADAYISSGYNQNFIFKSDPSSGQVERLRITPAGKVLVGSGVTDASLLNVKGSAGFADDGTNAGLIISTDDANGAALSCLTTGGFVNGAYGNMRLNALSHKFTYGNTVRLFIDSAGNLSLGRGAASSTQYGRNFQIHDTGTSGATLHLTTSDTGTANSDGYHLVQQGVHLYHWLRETGDQVFATAGSERLRIDSSGNIGQAVTPSAWSSDQANDFFAYQVGSGTAIFGRASGDEDRGGISANLYCTASEWKYIANGNGGRIYFEDGSIVFNTCDSGSAGTTATLNERFKIKTDGSVMIGSGDPSEDLHLKKARANFLVEGTNDTVSGNVANINVRAPYYRKAGYSISDTGGNEDFWIGRPYGEGDTTAAVHINMGGVERLNILSGGNVKVSASSASGYVAEFNQTHTSNSAQILINSPTDSNSRPSLIDFSRAGTTKWTIGMGYNDAYNGFHISSGNLASGVTGSDFVVTSDGYTGIGNYAAERTDPVISLLQVTTNWDNGGVPMVHFKGANNEAPTNGNSGGNISFQISDENSNVLHKIWNTGGGNADYGNVYYAGRMGIGVNPPEAVLHPRANAYHGTDIAFQVGTGNRFFKLEELSGQDNFGRCYMSFHDNSLREILTLENSYAGQLSMGNQIVFRGYGGKTGDIRVYNTAVNSTQSKMDMSASGAVGIEIEHNGYVTSPNNPSFWYSGLSNTASSGATSNTEILLFTTERHKQGNHYNPSNGRFTAPVAGTYWFSFNGLVDNSGSNSHFWAQLWRSGSMVNNIGYTFSNNGEYTNFSGSACIYLGVNDYAQIYAASNIHTGGETSFSGHLIG